jgi:hypothetical protein
VADLSGLEKLGWELVARPILNRPGQTYRNPDNPKIVLHTTETVGLPNYPWPPHITVDVFGKIIWEHIEADKGAYALRSPGRPYSPNADAGPSYQIELITYARKVPAHPDDWYQNLDELLVYLCDELGVPKRFIPKGFGAAGWAYGTEARSRISWDELIRFTGILGHQHVPGNTHWDPGDLDLGRLPLSGDLRPPTPEPEEGFIVNVTKVQVSTTQNKTHDDVAIAQGVLHAKGFGAKVGAIDGFFGTKTKSGTVAFQKKAGLVQDGIIGPKTWAKLLA